MNEKKKLPAWLVPAIILAIVAVIGFIVYGDLTGLYPRICLRVMAIMMQI